MDDEGPDDGLAGAEAAEAAEQKHSSGKSTAELPRSAIALDRN
jgi:hypothetical protein